MNDNHPWKGLLVWQRTHQLILDIYSLTNKFPSEEKFGITQQIRRAAVSIANKIESLCSEISFLLNKLIKSINK